jgi:hypothetical protein
MMRQDIPGKGGQVNKLLQGSFCQGCCLHGTIILLQCTRIGGMCADCKNVH